MKKLLFIFLLLPFISEAQSTLYFRADSSMFYKQGGYHELILMNRTKDTLGYLYNYGNGRTRFDRPRSVPGGIKFGNDTILVSSTGGIDSLTYERYQDSCFITTIYPSLEKRYRLYYRRSPPCMG